MDKKGQALVETAIIMPALMFLFLVGVMLVILACMKIRLLRSTARTAQAMAVSSGTLAATETLPGWKRYSGVSTLDTPGRLVIAETSLSLRFPARTLHARATFLQQPQVPGESQ